MEQMTLIKIMNEIGETNLLKLKRKLQFYKSQGFLFYTGTLYNKEWDEPFELYYALTKGSITYFRAFPIPIDFYKRRMKSGEVDLLLPYIRSYFECANVVNEVLPLLDVYYGKHYIWFYLT